MGILTAVDLTRLSIQEIWRQDSGRLKVASTNLSTQLLTKSNKSFIIDFSLYKEPWILARVVLLIIYTVCICLTILHFFGVITMYYLNQLRLQGKWLMPWYYFLRKIIHDLLMQLESIILWLWQPSTIGSIILWRGETSHWTSKDKFRPSSVSIYVKYSL